MARSSSTEHASLASGAGATRLSSYDQVPYTSYSYPRSHPDRLASIARLFGMQPAPVERCRVLEIGCASGGNLIPMAELLPRCTFVGLDASGRQIAAGRALVAETGLDNVRLEHADVLEVDASWGSFDYIICHGVYSWVEARVQDKILALMRERLEPRGVGYVSYNVYPGWHMREAIRHMMRYHVRSIAHGEERVAQARAFLDFVATHVPPDGPHALLLERELQILRNTSADYLFHEHLEEVNVPVYFHQFAEKLEQHGLAYLGDADLHTMLLAQHPPALVETLERLAPDIVSMEQYMDFLRNRQFRSTLVCRREVELERALSSDVVERFSIAFSPGSEMGPVDLTPGLPQELVSSGDVRLSSERSLTKAALVLLRAQWPRSLPFEDLYQQARDVLGEAGIRPRESRSDLAADLLACHTAGAGVLLRSWVPPMAARPGRRPSTTRVARAQAVRGSHVANLLHDVHHLDRAHASILRLLDGTRTEPQIVDALADQVVAGELDLTLDDRPIRERDQMHDPLLAVLQETLREFVTHALLLPEPS